MDLDNLVKEVDEIIKSEIEKVDRICTRNSIKVIDAFQECDLQEHHVNTSTG